MAENYKTNKFVNTNALSFSELAGFRSVFKMTTIFGGVQLFNVLTSLARGKILAILIGTTGMGLNGLLMSSLQVINRISSLGLSESAVRNIAEANSSKSEYRIARIYTVFKRWIWVTAIIGVLLTVSLSPILSKLAFGDGSYTIAFILLSVTFIFGALTGGIYTLLRGLRKIKDLAKANVAGSLAGLLITFPFFYYLGIDGVVPAIIAAAIATYLVSIYFKRKVKFEPVVLGWKETFREGKQMASLGITLSLSSLLSSGVAFLLNAYISKHGNLEDLGIFGAGQSIMNGYVGMVFAAMGTDYYPRLAGVINNPEDWTKVVNQQIEIVLLILGPILTFILLSAPLLIKLLLSIEFLPAIDYIVWSSLAVLLKGIVWASGFILIAKAANRMFLNVQIASALWFLPISILLYKGLGLSGLGLASVIDYFLSAILMYYLLLKKYSFVISKAAYKLTFINMILLGLSIATILIFNFPDAYFVCGFAFLISLIISLIGLNRRLNLSDYLHSLWKRKK